MLSHAQAVRLSPLESGFYNRMSIPKHRFIFWLMVQNRLLTKDKLLEWCIPNIDTMCVMCSRASEIAPHLFLIVLIVGKF